MRQYLLHGGKICDTIGGSKPPYGSGHNGANSKFRQKLGISSPRKLLLIPGFQKFKSNIFMFSLLLFSPKDFASQKQAKIYGDVPKRLKGPHSKCGRSAQTDARVRISPSPPPKKPVIKPIMGFFIFAQRISLHDLRFSGEKIRSSPRHRSTPSGC